MRTASLLRIAVLPIVGALSVSLMSCGGGGGDNVGPDLGGTIDTTTFSIPAGTTRNVTSNLIVKASESIDVSGTMNIKPGVSVALLSSKDLTVSGVIQSESAAQPVRVIGRGRDGQDDSLVLYAGRMALSGKLSPDKPILGCGNGDDATLTVTGAVRTQNGAAGKDRTDNGHNASSIEIGNVTATDALSKLGFECKPLATVSIGSAGVLTPGDGGPGFNDADGVVTGRDVAYTGTDGGRGGDLAVVAVKIEANGIVQGGRGGDGGKCNNVTFKRAADGIAPGEKGGSVTMTFGNGGAGGDALLSGDVSGTMQQIGGGKGGNAGLGFPNAGNGGPGGDGGDMTVRTGTKGAGGFWRGAPAAAGNDPAVTAEGGNGGDSEDPARPGGKGGVLTISDKAGGALALHPISTVTDALSGGFGFNGCAVVPQTKGTTGGNGGRIDCPVSITVGDESLAGGDGGDGTQPAAGGTGGNFGITKIGSDGAGGVPCSFSPPPGTAAGFLAVQLDHDHELKLGFDKYATLAKGDIVPLCRIRHGHASGPEPIVPEENRGCGGMHLHTKAGTDGIVVRSLEKTTGKPSAWRVFKPLTDPEPKKCGFGMLVVIQECKIITKDSKLQ